MYLSICLSIHGMRVPRPAGPLLLFGAPYLKFTGISTES